MKSPNLLKIRTNETNDFNKIVKIRFFSKVTIIPKNEKSDFFLPGATKMRISARDCVPTGGATKMRMSARDCVPTGGATKMKISKSDYNELLTKLDSMCDLGILRLKEDVERGYFNYLKLYFQYMYGKGGVTK